MESQNGELYHQTLFDPLFCALKLQNLKEKYCVQERHKTHKLWRSQRALIVCPRGLPVLQGELLGLVELGDVGEPLEEVGDVRGLGPSGEKT